MWDNVLEIIEWVITPIGVITRGTTVIFEVTGGLNLNIFTIVCAMLFGVLAARIVMKLL